MFNSTPVAQKISQHEDELNTLKRWLDLVDNPQPLLDAHKLARDEAVLTGEQQSKHADAVEFISNYEQLSGAIELRLVALKSDEETYSADVESFKAWRREETEKLEKQKEEQDIVARKNEAAEKKLASDRKEMEQHYSDIITPIDDDKEQNRIDREANEKEAARLKKLAAKLEKKSSKVKEALESDEDEEEAA